jgi:hypothetical protein
MATNRWSGGAVCIARVHIITGTILADVFDLLDCLGARPKWRVPGDFECIITVLFKPRKSGKPHTFRKG